MLRECLVKTAYLFICVLLRPRGLSKREEDTLTGASYRLTNQKLSPHINVMVPNIREIYGRKLSYTLDMNFFDAYQPIE